MTGLSIFAKSETERDKKYLQLITTLPCLEIGCGVSNYVPEDGLIAYHHVRGLGLGGGTGMKPSDYFTIPLCNQHHTLVHQSGLISLKLDTVDILKFISNNLIDYFTKP